MAVANKNKITRTKMNPKVRDLWVKALRGKGFTQGYGRMGYIQINSAENTSGQLCQQFNCPLGVLSELARVKSGSNVPVEVSGLAGPGCGSALVNLRYGGQGVMPPPRVLRWAGLNSAAAIIVIGMNDEERRSFKQIATWIEENL